MKATISFEIELDNISTYTDSYLASLWHIAQANPADGFASREPGEIAEMIGREIIRRFLTQTAPELWHHQGRHFDWGRTFLPKEAEAPIVVSEGDA